MTDKKIAVKPHTRSKPKEKTPKEISDPQIRATEGIQRLGGGDPRNPNPEKGVQIVRRSQ